MHTIAVVAVDGVLLFDLSTPCEVFGRVRIDGSPVYDVSVCGPSDEVEASGLRLRIPFGLDPLARAQTVVVPGLADPEKPIPNEVATAIKTAADSGARIASICTGAFVLAACGLLDGLRATTHWQAAPELARRYPNIDVDPNVLFVDNGAVLTSAGAAAGIDLCLHMIRSDHGSAVAAAAARAAVMPLEREGGQAQFIVHEPPTSSASLAPLLDWMKQSLGEPLLLTDLAEHAAMSPRTLSRRFREQTGATPRQWLQVARVRRAQELLETTTLSIDRVATESGFGSAATLRDNFSRAVGTSPQTYGRSFGRGTR